jgi:hypothetical protein
LVEVLDLASTPDSQHHIPNILVFEELVDLLTVINIVVFGHLIFIPFYADTIIDCGSHKLSLFALGRRKAQELLNFIHNRFLIIMEYREVGICSLFTTYLVQQLRCLLRGKRFAAKLLDKAAEGGKCTVDALVVNVAESFHDKSWFLEELQRQKLVGRQDTTYAWVDPAVYTVKVRDIPLNGESHLSSWIKDSRVIAKPLQMISSNWNSQRPSQGKPIREHTPLLRPFRHRKGLKAKRHSHTYLSTLQYILKV